MVVATALSQRHVGSLAEKLIDSLKQEGLSNLHAEGKETCDWVLVDAGDVIVHIFKPGVREIYSLEKLWSVSPPKE